MDGAPGEIRTPDRSVRSRVLYPAELQAHNFEGAILRIFASICQRKLSSCYTRASGELEMVVRCEIPVFTGMTL
jgi:hypothetical protein